ncbi:hypothetical protein [Sinorhizobium meliloti]|jgi:Ni/Co efflux regulator RcnB|uniref:hypothetical protein n=1 Tax=Rhizobium meliloti TaxID=382 RepID=UPI0020BFDA80|nr:hypothetical protein [Sinorhizobium meliloti]
MSKLLSALIATILAASFALPLNAAPIFVPKPAQVQADSAEQVNHRHYRHWRAERHWNRRHAYRSCGYYGRCYPRHYGYSNYRPYHRYHRYHRRSGVTIFFNF